MTWVTWVKHSMVYLFLIFNIAVTKSWKHDDCNRTTHNETSYKTYKYGINLGIINPKKYSFSAFRRHERTVFQDSYKQYISSNNSLPMNYREWLVMNNFGILSDIQESILQRKTPALRSSTRKRQFLRLVKMGDILITGKKLTGLIGHAAIVTTDIFVLEMPGGEGWKTGIPDNNDQLPVNLWYDVYKDEVINVYRCPDKSVAEYAARWADRTYFNPTGDCIKTIHVTYKLTNDPWIKNPSYCSKLVLQAYYFGVGEKRVVKDFKFLNRFIPPSKIPSYFLKPYELIYLGQF